MVVLVLSLMTIFMLILWFMMAIMFMRVAMRVLIRCSVMMLRVITTISGLNIIFMLL